MCGESLVSLQFPKVEPDLAFFLFQMEVLIAGQLPTVVMVSSLFQYVTVNKIVRDKRVDFTFQWCFTTLVSIYFVGNFEMHL